MPTENSSGVVAARASATLIDDAPLSVAYGPGDVLGDKYVLDRMLGEGGMGVVWLARNRALGVDVALKLLRAGQRSPMLARRMLKEAQAVARLGHPAILRVFDFGTTQRGDPFMVMELLEGEDLGRTLERNGRLSPIKAVRTLLPVLHALGTAHQKDIVHRDLKPDNIFLTTTDSGYVQPKVVDFGIVKTAEPDLDRLTRLGAVIGTPAYLSPEQARGQDVDHRADIWAAAVVLYEMLTCRLPFEATNYNALMRSIIEDSPAPLASFGIDAEPLWVIIERGLCKRAEARWPSMAAFGGALASWLIAQGETDDISGASLRAAWHSGANAAHPDDLYSARPGRDRRVSEPTTVGSAAPRRSRRLGVRIIGVGVVLGLAALWAGSTLLATDAEPAVESLEPTHVTRSAGAGAAVPPLPSDAPTIATAAAPSLEPQPSRDVAPSAVAPETVTERAARRSPAHGRAKTSRRAPAQRPRAPSGDDLKTTL